ncbi:class I SAM-dependent methyltransferase [Priestia taiwanensis]|uniref:Methyltransferase n=1 Tax=Priestia taiwanensis TaxID=1347902 RepID=A0A917APN5_9BACI|nr:SAM-dependent methyltransferase [Priestia taiwanensis]MBM7362622.1 hypothetical protein [Priestia taiwanensis]GGE63736.1 methyltransferase [Priestia taiwanensis]
MLKDKEFTYFLEEANKGFSGWDFSYISGTGRMQSQLLPWSFGSMVLPYIRSADTMLDMGTGGGEFLSHLKPFPMSTHATEGYVPNVSIAKERLEPLGVKVVYFEEDSSLPFEDKYFSFIMNQHESYDPKELRRIISDGGMFITQQVGGLDYVDLNDQLGAEPHDEFAHWNLKYAVDELEKHNFKVAYSMEDVSVSRFYDVGACIYYLTAIPWQVPGFTVDAYIESLYDIHRTIQKQGYFEVKQHRFVLKAEAI